MSKFKPLLAGKAPADLDDLQYPVLASPKLDGIRCVIRDGVAMSRSLKPIPNEHVRAALEGIPDGVDGELMVAGNFSACSSFFMSKHKVHNDFWFNALDWDTSHGIPLGSEPFQDRLEDLTEWSEDNGHNNLRVVEHVLISNAEDLADYEAKCLAEGFEGVMVRNPDGPYKYGRSTTREGTLLKVKRFTDEEATIVGFKERQHNENEASCNECGHTERSTHKAGMVPAGDMGTMLCRTEDGAEFGIGSGFTSAQRVEFWHSKETLIGSTVKFKHQPDPGGRLTGQAPRFPVFLGFRDQADL